MDELQVKNELVRDAVESQKAAGAEPTPGAVDAYMQGVLRKLERRDAERKPVASANNSQEDVVAAEYEKRTGRILPDGWHIDREPEPIKKPERTVNMNSLGAHLKERLLTRLRWFEARPEMHNRIKGMRAAAASGDKKAAKRLYAELTSMEADRLAGRAWYKPEPQKLYSLPSK